MEPSTMKCPHCQVEVHDGFRDLYLGGNSGAIGEEDGFGTRWYNRVMVCPSCKKAILELVKSWGDSGDRWLVYPRNAMRPPAAAEVPALVAEDYNEACAVLSHSAKASAALSRRCLQSLLRLQGFTQKDLAPAIDALLATKQLPSWLGDNVDAIRNIGNFAAHPLKDTNTGAILPVEAEEAEWNLDVLEGLFDFYYVQPAKDAARRAAFNAKLQAAGKPPMK
jgi:hypothetical protein